MLFFDYSIYNFSLIMKNFSFYDKMPMRKDCLQMKLEYSITKQDENKTIKEILLSHFQISHRLLTTLKKENSIFLNDSPSFLYYSVKENDKIAILFDYEEDNSNIVPKEMKLSIVYEDEAYLVVNKPSGIPVHPSILHYEDSLSNGIAFYFGQIGLRKKIRPENRIDKDTSGLVVFAKNEYVQECLIRQMKTDMFQKTYFAIAEGFLEEKQGTINLPIARKENSIIERCVSSSGSPSVTHYKVLGEKFYHNLPISIVECTLETGRTHQIRVPLSYIGHPLLGDDLYGGNVNFIKRQALHSFQISFVHPISKEAVCYEAPLPEDLKTFLI